MSDFPRMLAKRIQGFVQLRLSLGYGFRREAAFLRAFLRYVEEGGHDGPLTQDLALAHVLASGASADGRARRWATLRRFAEYLAVYDPRTATLDPRALPPSRVIPPPRILNHEELSRLMLATRDISTLRPQRGRTLETLVGLLASTGLRSGGALRLDRSDVDLVEGVLQVRKTKFRKDRLVPVHATTRDALRAYARERDVACPEPKCPAFFVSLRGNRLSSAALYVAFHQACSLAGLDLTSKGLRPHDLRHRFAVVRLAEWHRQKLDVQALLPVLATYLGHVSYSETAYYVTGTAELLGFAAERAFLGDGGAS